MIAAATRGRAEGFSRSRWTEFNQLDHNCIDEAYIHTVVAFPLLGTALTWVAGVPAGVTGWTESRAALSTRRGSLAAGTFTPPPVALFGTRTPCWTCSTTTRKALQCGLEGPSAGRCVRGEVPPAQGTATTCDRRVRPDRDLKAWSGLTRPRGVRCPVVKSSRPTSDSHEKATWMMRTHGETWTSLCTMR